MKETEVSWVSHPNQDKLSSPEPQKTVCCADLEMNWFDINLVCFRHVIKQDKKIGNFKCILCVCLVFVLLPFTSVLLPLLFLLLLRVASRWQCWWDEASVAECQRPLSEAHDYPGRSFPLPRGGGKDGHSTKGVQRRENPGSLPGQTQTGAVQEQRRPWQPKTFHWLYYWRKFQPSNWPEGKKNDFNLCFNKRFLVGQNNVDIDLFILATCICICVYSEGLFVSMHCAKSQCM